MLVLVHLYQLCMVTNCYLRLKIKDSISNWSENEVLADYFSLNYEKNLSSGLKIIR